MIDILRIHDLALIEDAEMEFSPGLNVLTGETGAGKSFILKAISFLTGEKLTVDSVRPGKEKAVVEGLFYVDDQEYIIRRELMADTGRSRFYLNGQLSSLESIRELRSSLILHTSQHGQHKLLLPSYQAQILDDFMDAPEILEQRNQAVAMLEDLRKQRTELAAKVQELEAKREVLEFQNEEIKKVNPKEGEEEELEVRRERLRNLSGIQSALEQAMQALHGDDGAGLYSQLGSLERAVGSLGKYVEGFEDSGHVLLEVRELLQDVENGLRSVSRMQGDEKDMEYIEARLYAIAQLKRKMRRPLGDIVSFKKEIQSNLEFLDNCKLEERQIAIREEEWATTLAKVLGKLNPLREQAAQRLSASLENELKNLGFSSHVRVIFSFSPYVLYNGREDCVELRPRLLWQPNPGQAEQVLDRIASGGELSRFLLALVTLLSKLSTEKPSLIFDEVDAGVGGLTLNKVAESIVNLGAERQILLITHWPHLAKHAKRHFVVQKTIMDGQTFTTCKKLDNEDIPLELARMAGLESPE